jgi:hypothetical protein
MILQPLISKHEYTKYMISVTLPSKKVIMALRFFPGIWHETLAAGNQTWMVSSDESMLFHHV